MKPIYFSNNKMKGMIPYIMRSNTKNADFILFIICFANHYLQHEIKQTVRYALILVFNLTIEEQLN